MRNFVDGDPQLRFALQLSSVVAAFRTVTTAHYYNCLSTHSTLAFKMKPTVLLMLQCLVLGNQASVVYCSTVSHLVWAIFWALYKALKLLVLLSCVVVLWKKNLMRCLFCVVKQMCEMAADAKTPSEYMPQWRMLPTMQDKTVKRCAANKGAMWQPWTSLNK